jgi:hypothetical protein
MSVAVYLDLESEHSASHCGTASSRSRSFWSVNSGDPDTLEQFLLWAFDTCPARRGSGDAVRRVYMVAVVDSQTSAGRPSAEEGRLRWRLKAKMRSSCTSSARR